SILTALTSIFALMRTVTRPPPDVPSTSSWPSSSCIACIFDCSCAACFIMPRKSGIGAPLNVLLFAHDLFGKPLHTFPDHALKIVAVRATFKVLRGNIEIARLRRLGRELAHLDHLGAGKASQHFLDPGIGLGGALALVFRHQVLLAQRRLTLLIG